MLIDPCHELDEMPAGVRSMTVHVKPVAFRNAGALTRIEPAFANSGLVERPHIVTLAPFNVSVGDGGTRRIHPTRELDVWFEIGRPYRVDTRQPFPMNALIRSENKLTSTNTNYILSLVHGGHFVKLEIELLNGVTPPNNQFAFPIALNGLTYSNGTLLQAGVPVMNLVRPIVYDAANPNTPPREITHTITTLAGQTYVIFTLPSLVGITRPIIDPTFTSQPDAAAGNDTTMRDDVPDTNQGAQIFIRVGRFSTPQVGRGLIKFDLSSIPSTATVTSSNLSLFIQTDYHAVGETCNHHIYRCLRAWSEADATWNEFSSGNNWGTAGADNTTSDREATSRGSFARAETDADNTKIQATLNAASVQEMFSGVFTNNGWVIKTDSEIGTKLTDWYSSDDANSANRPKLVIVYTEAAAGNPWHAYAQQ